jgi:F0F1-type ATP synthase epsilon subunit
VRVSVLTPRSVLWEGDAEEVNLPGDSEELCVMDFHKPLLCSLRSGYIKIKESQTKKESRILVKQGIAKMRLGALVILAQTY